MHRKMLGDTIFRLRKEKGMSQSQLGEAVGVSNKAVSKWETYEANPDIGLLPLLAKALGVTTDELLTDIKTERGDPKPVETRVLGIRGSALDSDYAYEFVSDRKRKDGSPFLHIHVGKQLSTINAKARGFVAVGNNAKGVVSIGFVSVGVVSLGLLSMGLLAIGVFGLGLVSICTIAFGALALGAIAVGAVAIGAVAIGFVALGAVAVGYHAFTGAGGEAFGRHIFVFPSRFERGGLR